MQISTTNIRDNDAIVYNNDTASKLFLMEEILQIFTPLFSTEIDRKQQQLESNKRDYLELREKVSHAKTKLQGLDQELRREKLKASILKEMKSLIDHDLMYGKNKKIVTDIFNGMGTASRKELELQLNQLRKLIHKALAK